MNNQLEKFYNGIALGLTNPVGPVIIFQRNSSNKISCWLGYDHIAEIIQNFAAERVGVVNYYNEPLRLEQAQNDVRHELLDNPFYATLAPELLTELQEISAWPKFKTCLFMALEQADIIPEPRLEFQIRQADFLYQAQSTGKNSCGLSCYCAPGQTTALEAPEFFDSPTQLFVRILTANNSSYRLLLHETEIVAALKNSDQEFIPGTDENCSRQCRRALEKIIQQHRQELPRAYSCYQSQKSVVEL